MNAEHRRPLVAFLAVVALAVAIVASGLQPGQVRHALARTPVIAARLSPDRLLGPALRTLPQVVPALVADRPAVVDRDSSTGAQARSVAASSSAEAGRTAVRAARSVVTTVRSAATSLPAVATRPATPTPSGQGAGRTPSTNGSGSTGGSGGARPVSGGAVDAPSPVRPGVPTRPTLVGPVGLVPTSPTTDSGPRGVAHGWVGRGGHGPGAHAGTDEHGSAKPGSGKPNPDKSGSDKSGSGKHGRGGTDSADARSGRGHGKGRNPVRATLPRVSAAAPTLAGPRPVTRAPRSGSADRPHATPRGRTPRAPEARPAPAQSHGRGGSAHGQSTKGQSTKVQASKSQASNPGSSKGQTSHGQTSHNQTSQQQSHGHGSSVARPDDRAKQDRPGGAPRGRGHDKH